MPESLFFKGTFSTAFENSFLEHLSDACSKEPLRPKVVLVGSNLLGIHLRRGLARKMGGHANVRFLTFVDLSDALRNTCGDFRISFPDGSEELLIAMLASSTITNDHYFFSCRDQKGFHLALKKTFHDLMDGGVWMLPPLTPKISEISTLFHLYREKSSSHFVSSADRIAKGASCAHAFGSTFQTSTLYCYGFYDLTEIQRRLLQACSKTISLRVWMPLPRTLNSQLAGTERFFSDLVGPVTIIPSTPASIIPTLLACPGEFQEASENVRHLLATLEKRSISLDRVGILVRDPQYVTYFSEILSQSCIPFYREGGQPLTQSRLGQGISRLLALLPGEWTRADMIEVLSLLPFLSERVAALGSSSDWDRWSRQARAQNEAESIQDGPRSNFNLFLKKWQSDLAHLRQNSTSWEQFSKVFVSFLRDYFSPSVELELVLQTVLDLGSFETLGIPSDAASICGVLQKRIANLSLSGGQFEKDGLFLGSLVSARMIPFDLVILPGLAERRFPAPSSPDPLLLDYERKQVNETAGGGLAIREHRVEEERSLFEYSVMSAQKALFISYPRRDLLHDRETAPSSFLLEVPKNTPTIQTPLFSWREKRQGEFLHKADWLASDFGYLSLTDPEASHAQLVTWNPLASSVRDWVENRLGSWRWTHYDGIVDLPPPVSSRVFSPTELSTFAICPYRYFLRYKLNLKPTEDPDSVEHVSALDYGNMIHAILFQFFSQLKKEGRLPLQRQDEKELASLLEEIAMREFEKAQRTLVLGPSPVWEIDRMFLLADLQTLLSFELRDSQHFIPHAFELSFGPIDFPVENQTFRLKGRLDRLDLSLDQKRARVVDYKSGTLRGVRDDKFDGGRSIALPVYLQALSTLAPSVDLSSSFGLLMSTSYRGGFSEIYFSGQTFKDRRQDFITILTTVTEGIQKGHFPPHPGAHRSNCKSCDFERICGEGIERVFERKKNDPSHADLWKLEEIE